MAARVFGLALIAAALAAPPALASRAAHSPAHAGAKRDAVRAGKAHWHAYRPKHRLVHKARRSGTRLARASRSPRMPDAPLDLLPAPRLIQAMHIEAAAASPRTACLAAARRAERIHGLPDGLLVAIAMSESGLHAHALNIGGRSQFPESPTEARALLAAAPRGATIMAGCVQVNLRVHARGADWPLDAERSADWAGGLLRRWYSETGSWAEALALWHGGSPASTRRVLCRVRAKLDVTSPGSPVLFELGCAGLRTQRERRDGEAVLSVAEAPLR